MSLFGRRERKRIAELEEENRALREDLAVAVVPYGMPLNLVVAKGKWYTASFKFMHSGAPILNLRDLIVENDARAADYFDGSTPPRYQWTGEPATTDHPATAGGTQKETR